jgi:hypothetical protein
MAEILGGSFAQGRFALLNNFNVMTEEVDCEYSWSQTAWGEDFL